MTKRDPAAVSLHYGDTIISFHCRRTAQAGTRVRIHVEPDGRVIVDAPPDAELQAIKQAVRRRAAWVHQQVEAARSRWAALPSKDWVSGEAQRYLGRRYVLKIVVDPTQAERAVVSGGYLRVFVHRRERDTVQGLVRDWYRARAEEWLTRRVADWSTALPWVRQMPPITLRPMNSRWGSCSPRGRLTLNPLLIRAPREAVDYVIVHELCHLKHHDHGAAFYKLLDRYVRDWRRIKTQLDDLAEALFAER